LSELTEERAPLWERAGSAALVATVWSGLGALPAAMRVASDGDVSAFAAWSFCAACLAPFMLLTIALLRSARAGARAIGGDTATAKAIAFTAWLVVMTGVLARFGALLRDKTHHHALAGATFAIGALVFGVITAMLAARLVGWLASQTSKRIAIVALLLLALLVARSLGRGLATMDPLTRAWLIDATIALVCAFFGAITPSVRRWVARLGWLALVALFVLGWRFSTSRELAPRLAEHAPVYALVRSL
jgi:hypothetical protein